MHKLNKFLVIIGISILVLPLYAVAKEMQITWLSIPLAVGYVMAILAVWKK